MKSSFFTLASSVLVALASAYTQPVGSPSGNPIFKPGLQEQVPVGQPYTITWNPTTSGTVTLVLLRGPGENIKPLYPIAEGIANTGTYTWTPSSNLEIDVTHYGLELIVDATGQYQYSTQFGISNPGGLPSPPSSSPPSPPSSPSSSPPSPPYPSSSSSSSSSAYTTRASLMSSSTTYIIAPTSSMPPSSARIYPSTTPCSNSSAIKPQDASTAVRTSIVTIISCAATVQSCPGRSTTVAPVVSVPTPATVKYSTYWGNNTMITTTPTSSLRVASTGFGVSTTSSLPPHFTGAGDKVRVGCAMGAVMVAALALAL